MNRRAWGGPNSANREAFRDWFGEAVETFRGILYPSQVLIIFSGLRTVATRLNNRLDLA